MATLPTPTIRATLRGLVRDALASGDAFSGAAWTELGTICRALETPALEGLLQSNRAEFQKFRQAFDDYERRIAALPEADRQGRPGVEAAQSLAATWATPGTCKRLMCGNATGAGGSLAARVAACLRELEQRYQANPKLRPVAQVDALARATKAEAAELEARAKVKALQKSYRAASLQLRPALEREVAEATATADKHAGARDEAMREARTWSAVP